MSHAQAVIGQLDQTISNFKARVDVKVNHVHTSTDNIQATTDKIYDTIVRFKTDMLHGEEKQIAHENILRIEQIIKEQFQNYAEIRRTVQGIVRDFDINLVRNSTIQELSEELWITSSRYWLSYAMIAITAWVNDYPDVAKNALAECCRKDGIKSTLFFCLMNLRFGRLLVAKEWFEEYFKTLDPSKLQQETAVMLQAFLNGVFGKDKEMENRIIATIKDWIQLISEDDTIAAQLIGAYEQFIHQMRITKPFEYEAVKQFCTNHPELQNVHSEVQKYYRLINFANTFDIEAEPQYDENYKNRIDAILFNLMSIPDREEQDLKNQQEYYRFIVDNEGVVEEAQAQYDAMVALQNENFNIGKHMLNWVLYDDSADMQVRKFAFQNTKEWLKSAVGAWDTKMHAQFPREYRLEIDAWDGISNGTDEEEQTQSIRNFFENNKFQNMFVNTPNIAAGIVFVLSIALVFTVGIFALIATALSGAFLAWNIIKALMAYPRRVDDALKNLSATMAEIADFKNTYNSTRAKKDELLSVIEKI